LWAGAVPDTFRAVLRQAQQPLECGVWHFLGRLPGTGAAFFLWTGAVPEPVESTAVEVTSGPFRQAQCPRTLYHQKFDTFIHIYDDYGSCGKALKESCGKAILLFRVFSNGVVIIQGVRVTAFLLDD
jgi:hypothetical protein